MHASNKERQTLVGGRQGGCLMMVVCADVNAKLMYVSVCVCLLPVLAEV